MESTSDATLRWEEGDVDARKEHFRLWHATVADHPVALVGPRRPAGLCVRFVPDLSGEVPREIRDELWTWCTPQPDDPFFADDLWHHLVAYALAGGDEAGAVRWELVPIPSEVGAQPPFIHDVTELYRAWVRQAESELAASDPEAREKMAARVAFIRDYVALIALVGGDPRQAVGRLSRLVRLQTGEDPTARFDIQLTGPGSGDVHVRLGHIEDFSFADAWACVPFEGFIVTKLARKEGNGRPAPPWRRNEVRALLRHVDVTMTSEMPCTGLVAESDGPRLTVRFCGEAP